MLVALWVVLFDISKAAHVFSCFPDTLAWALLWYLDYGSINREEKS